MKFTKTLTSGLLITTLFTLTLAGCGESGPTKSDAAEMADKMIADFESGVPIIYTENMNYEDQKWDLTLKRDSANNLFVSDIGVIDSSAYEYVEYRIDDVCYIEDGGTFIESASADYDPAAYFNDQITNVSESLTFCLTDTFDPLIETKFAVEGDNMVITGVYEEDDSPYTLTMAIDGTKMTYEDDSSKYTIDFTFSETLALPN